jgi:hypothetical protein
MVNTTSIRVIEGGKTCMKSQNGGSNGYKAKPAKIKGDMSIQFFTAKVDQPIKPAKTGTKTLKL